MKVPPSSAAASTTPMNEVHKTLAATPAASMRQAIANAGRMPVRCATQVQIATEGVAATLTSSQIDGSSGAIAVFPRTMATRKVAVMT